MDYWLNKPTEVGPLLAGVTTAGMGPGCVKTIERVRIDLKIPQKAALSFIKAGSIAQFFVDFTRERMLYFKIGVFTQPGSKAAIHR